METTLQGNSRARAYKQLPTLPRGLGWGLLGGLVGTLFMDLFLMSVLFSAGLPALTCFSIVGDTAARFFSILGMTISGGVPLGVAAHYLIGPLVGAVYGAVMARVPALQAGSLKKCFVLAVLYVEILSQPMLVMTPILLKYTLADTLEWFGGSFVMHFIWAIVLGVFVRQGLQLQENPSGLLGKPAAQAVEDQAQPQAGDPQAGE